MITFHKVMFTDEIIGTFIKIQVSGKDMTSKVMGFRENKNQLYE